MPSASAIAGRELQRTARLSELSFIRWVAATARHCNPFHRARSLFKGRPGSATVKRADRYTQRARQCAYGREGAGARGRMCEHWGITRTGMHWGTGARAVETQGAVSLARAEPEKRPSVLRAQQDMTNTLPSVLRTPGQQQDPGSGRQFCAHAVPCPSSPLKMVYFTYSVILKRNKCHGNLFLAAKYQHHQIYRGCEVANPSDPLFNINELLPNSDFTF